MSKGEWRNNYIFPAIENPSNLNRIRKNCKTVMSPLERSDKGRALPRRNSGEAKLGKRNSGRKKSAEKEIFWPPRLKILQLTFS